MPHAAEHNVRIPVQSACIDGVLVRPPGATGLVLFAHGSGSSRHSPRNQYVAKVLQDKGMATLLADLLTPLENQDVSARFDIPLLTGRLLAVIRWAKTQPATQALPLGLFGASTGAAAALLAAAAPGTEIQAVVSRGGRPDLVGPDGLGRVPCPTLLLVGGNDSEVLALNQAAALHMKAPVELMVIRGASHLFEEAGTLEEVALQAASWFVRHWPRIPWGSAA